VISPILDSNKKIIGAVASFNDITKRRQLDELKKEFLATAAHELKTPITTLTLLSQLQIKKIRKNQPINPAEFDLIDGELDRLTRIINDILDDQRAETGKLNLRMEYVDLSSLINKVINQMMNLSPNHKLLLRKSVPIKVVADPDRIGQVLTNLITNAIKYSPVNTKIIISSKIVKNLAQVIVKDEGMGIPLEKQEKIFDRFYQIQESKSTGFGLGLYISKQIIEHHRGKIKVDSKEGEGSTFSFSLPLAN
jgi:signal transduction histidine kinase